MQSTAGGTHPPASAADATPSRDIFKYVRGRAPREIANAIFAGVFFGALWGTIGGIIIAIISAKVFDVTDVAAFYRGWAVSGIIIGIWNFLTYYKPEQVKLSPELEQVLQRQEELFNRLTAAQSGSSEVSRLAKAALLVRANSARQNLERIWDRSQIAFGMGCVFLASVFIPPAAAFVLVLKFQDWRYFIASTSTSAVLLAAAAALFRQESKLREQFQLVVDEVSYFDRLQVALDCAQASSETTYKSTLKQIVTFLVTPGPVLATSAKGMALEKAEADSPNAPDLGGKIIEATSKLADHLQGREGKGS